MTERDKCLYNVSRFVEFEVLSHVCVFLKKKCYALYAEILGALLSILFLWILTGVLFYMAVRRVIDQNYTINATIMLITAACGVAFNIM